MPDTTNPSLPEGAPALVSVIVPVYNGAQYLAESLDSALAQDYPNLEVVVVDDGSTDGTPAILERYAQRFAQRVRVITQPNRGAAAARNAALLEARGEYVAFLDADDLWAPHKLSIQVLHLGRHPDVDLVYSAWMVVEGKAAAAQARAMMADTGGQDIDESGSGWLYNELLTDCVLHTTTVVMRRRLLESVGLFDAELRRGQDYDYWLRASRVTRIHKMRQALSIYRQHESNSTLKPVRTNYSGIIVQRAVDRWGLVGPDGKATPAAVVRGRLAQSWSAFGYAHARAGNRLLALGAFARSMRYRPLQPRVWALALATAIPGLPRLLGWR